MTANSALPSAITFRPDEQTATALEQLMLDGASASAAIRRAVIETARAERRAALLQEARELAGDKGDLAEARRVLVDMEVLRAR